ncbi:hypothetical protein LX86_008957 [Lentzea aerocolonigenes]|nr:hypothetical protein [Lentzea aerocolonigenes]
MVIFAPAIRKGRAGGGVAASGWRFGWRFGRRFGRRFGWLGIYKQS